MIQFGEWTPDLIASVSSVQDAKNVLPYPDGYRPLRDLSAKTSALASACVGAAWFVDDDNAPQTFAGTTDKLYKRSGATWSDFSKVGGYDGAHWEFVKFGDRCIGTNGADSPQWVDMTSGTIFADLTGAPIARCIATVRDFVVFGDLTESATAYPSRVRWSGYNNSEAYGSSLATQADYQDLFGNGGRIQRVVSGDVGVIFQERSIWTMTYVGPSVIFNFQEVEPSRGTPAPDSVCWSGRSIFYYSHDGFYTFSVGNGSQPIGTGKINDWFRDRLDTTRLDAIRGVVDRETDFVIWSFPSTSADTVNDSLLFYHIPTGRWSYASVSTEVIFEAASIGYTLDELDSILTDIDTASIPVDTRAFMGGAIILGAFDTSHKLATFDGDFLTAEIETGEQINQGRFFLTSAMPFVDGGSSVTVQVGKRNLMTENVSWGPVCATNSVGEITTRVNARLIRFKVYISGGFVRAHGIDPRGNAEGIR